MKDLKLNAYKFVGVYIAITFVVITIIMLEKSGHIGRHNNYEKVI